MKQELKNNLQTKSVMKIAISKGHNTPYNGGSNTQYGNEDKLNLEITDEVVRLLIGEGHNVKDVTPATASSLNDSLQQRCTAADNFGADLYVEIHHNTGGGTGTETFVYNPSWTNDLSVICAKDINERITSAMGYANRGVKNGSHLYVIKNTLCQSLLVEVCFLDNKDDMAKHDPKKIAKAIAEGIQRRDIGQVTPPLPPAKTPILNSPTCTKEQSMTWAKKNGATEKFIGLAHYFWSLAPKHGGVDPAIAYAQSAKETGYGKFGGVLDESYRNPCGLKGSSGGGDYDPNAHKKFETWEKGVSAQLDHLALYAGADGYPRAETEDPRHFPYLKGSCVYVEDLGGKWAPSPSYGTSVLSMVEKIKSTVADGTNALPTDEQEKPPQPPDPPEPPPIIPEPEPEPEFKPPVIGGGTIDYTKPSPIEISIPLIDLSGETIITKEMYMCYFNNEEINTLTPKSIDVILDEYFRNCEYYSVNSDLIICQAIYETNFFTFFNRKINPDSYNYGAVYYKDRKKFNSREYPYWEQGVYDHVITMQSYVQKYFSFEEATKNWINISYDGSKYLSWEDAVNKKGDYSGKVKELISFFQNYWNDHQP